MSERIYLSDPHMGGAELAFVQDAFDTNWVAPLGPHVDAFEAEFSRRVNGLPSAALSSGTAALHLAFQLMGVRPGDRVVVSDLTFVASVNPIRYVGAEPVLVDAEHRSWNMDPDLLDEALTDLARKGTPARVVEVVHLYGQSADMDRIMEICARHGAALLEDASEALGGDYRGRPVGSMGEMATFSFNGNKIITTGGGGMLVAKDAERVGHARRLASQAREPVVHYEHTEIGYNYRLSNILAAIGRGQLQVLDERVAARRRVFERYEAELGMVPGIAFMPDAGWGTHTRWLTCLTVDPAVTGTDRETLRLLLNEVNIEARPVWMPMHMQPLYRDAPLYGGAVGRKLFETGLCLPSGSSLTPERQQRVIDVMKEGLRV